jgi:hypothetical protein
MQIACQLTFVQGPGIMPDCLFISPILIHSPGYVNTFPGMLFLGITKALCRESDWGSTSNVLMLMLYWSEEMIRNSMYCHQTQG